MWMPIILMSKSALACMSSLGAVCDKVFPKPSCLVLSEVIYYLRLIKWHALLDGFLGWGLKFH